MESGDRMSKLIVNNIDSRSTSTEFKDIITANHKKQWLDTYGVIKAFKNTIDENVTIPSELMVSVLAQQKFHRDILSLYRVSEDRMTSKLVVNTIEADTGISSVSFGSSISLSSTSKFFFGGRN